MGTDDGIQNNKKDFLTGKGKQATEERIKPLKILKERLGKETNDTEESPIKLVLKLPSFTSTETSKEKKIISKKLKRTQSKNIKHIISTDAQSNKICIQKGKVQNS